VLLSIWIAEAILEHESPASKRAKKALRRRSSAPR
jgi:hypothetical protein